MKKLFYYELRRVLLRWLFAALLVVNGIYAWYVLTTDIIRGIAYTAPFSIWSYCTFIGKMMPAAAVTILLLLSGYYGKKQKQVEILTSAAPVTPAQHLLIRSAVLAVCFALVCAVITAAAVFFYSSFFQYYDYAVFVLPGLLMILPCFLFTIGVGHLLGRMHQGLPYVFMGIVFLAGLSAADHVLDLFGAGYFSSYPLSLQPDQSGEPAFLLQPAWIAARILYFLLGLALLLWNAGHAKRKLTKADA